MTDLMFMSPEWMTETEKVLRAKITPQTTNNATLSIAMTVENAPDGKVKTLVFETDKGNIKTFKLADPANVKTEFAISGDYATYMKVFKGQLDPTKALFGGDLSLKGNMLKAMGMVNVLTPFFSVLGGIPAEFL